jgi:hypothetical protein
MRCGDFTPLEQVNGDVVRRFLDGIERFRPALERLQGRMDGTPEVVRIIERRLEYGSASLRAEPDVA